MYVIPRSPRLYKIAMRRVFAWVGRQTKPTLLALCVSLFYVYVYTSVIASHAKAADAMANSLTVDKINGSLDNNEVVVSAAPSAIRRGARGGSQADGAADACATAATQRRKRRWSGGWSSRRVRRLLQEQCQHRAISRCAFPYHLHHIYTLASQGLIH